MWDLYTSLSLQGRGQELNEKFHIKLYLRFHLQSIYFLSYILLLSLSSLRNIFIKYSVNVIKSTYGKH
jgi:hypothetical protein